MILLLEYIILTKGSSVLVGFGMVFCPEKFQIDIRYFIAIKAKEYMLKGMYSVLLQISPHLNISYREDQTRRRIPVGKNSLLALGLLHNEAAD